MCLYSKEVFRTKTEARKLAPKIAEKDIIVYKALTDNNFSPYQDMKYEKGNHYSAELVIEAQSRGHGVWKVAVENGLHAYVTRGSGSYGYSKRKMIIPKGALYVEGIHGDIVTTDLIWK